MKKAKALVKRLAIHLCALILLFAMMAGSVVNVYAEGLEPPSGSSVTTDAGAPDEGSTDGGASVDETTPGDPPDDATTNGYGDTGTPEASDQVAGDVFVPLGITDFTYEVEAALGEQV